MLLWITLLACTRSPDPVETDPHGDSGEDTAAVERPLIGHVSLTYDQNAQSGFLYAVFAEGLDGMESPVECLSQDVCFNTWPYNDGEMSEPGALPLAQRALLSPLDAGASIVLGDFTATPFEDDHSEGQPWKTYFGFINSGSIWEVAHDLQIDGPIGTTSDDTDALMMPPSIDVSAHDLVLWDDSEADFTWVGLDHPEFFIDIHPGFVVRSPAVRQREADDGGVAVPVGLLGEGEYSLEGFRRTAFDVPVGSGRVRVEGRVVERVRLEIAAGDGSPLIDLFDTCAEAESAASLADGSYRGFHDQTLDLLFPSSDSGCLPEGQQGAWTGEEFVRLDVAAGETVKVTVLGALRGATALLTEGCGDLSTCVAGASAGNPLLEDQSVVVSHTNETGEHASVFLMLDGATSMPSLGPYLITVERSSP